MTHRNLGLAGDNDTLCHNRDIAADLLAQIGELVDEGKSHCQIAIGGIFDELGRFEICEDQRCPFRRYRLIDLAQGLLGAIRFDAHDDTIGLEEIIDGRTLAQEFRIGSHVEFSIGSERPDLLLELARRADRHSGLGDDHAVAVKGCSNLTRRLVHISEIGGIVAAPRRRRDGDEDRLRLRHGRFEIAGEMQPAGLPVGMNEAVEPGFVNGDASGIEIIDPRRIMVDAEDIEAKFGEAGARNQPDIAGPDDSYFHEP
jgi:hypothetical protein